MNIYVESNFVLELVFEQEQCAACEQILALGEQGRAQLILPAYCLAEPHEKLRRQARVPRAAVTFVIPAFPGKSSPAGTISTRPL